MELRDRPPRDRDGVAQAAAGAGPAAASTSRPSSSFATPSRRPIQRFDARASLERAIGDDAESLTLLFRRYLDNVSGKELASELGLTPAALRMRLMRIRSSARARRGDA